MNLSCDLEHNYYSKATEGIYKFVHDSIRLIKWSVYYDRWKNNLWWLDGEYFNICTVINM